MASTTWGGINDKDDPEQDGELFEHSYLLN
jgi:hypothetical protein